MVSVSSKPFYHVTLSEESATRSLGEALGRCLRKGDIVGLIGDLGAGKTTLVQGLARGWGWKGDVTSPTFALANEYQAPQGPLYHLDMYRLDAAECEQFPIDEYIEADAACVIEWAERVLDRLPREILILRLSKIGSGRRIAAYSSDTSWLRRWKR